MGAAYNGFYVLDNATRLLPPTCHPQPFQVGQNVAAPVMVSFTATPRTAEIEPFDIPANAKSLPPAARRVRNGMSRHQSCWMTTLKCWGAAGFGKTLRASCSFPVIGGIMHRHQFVFGIFTAKSPTASGAPSAWMLVRVLVQNSV